MLEPLPRANLGLLLLDELRHADRRRGVRGELIEEAAVVGGVLLFRKPRSEVQQADELALTHERHSELHARLP